jgi:hypothetical protein
MTDTPTPTTPIDGGAAFPTEDDLSYHHGMSLRDYFAGQALAGILGCARDYQGVYSNKARAGFAYEVADAMLAARVSTKSGGATPTG